MNESKKTFPSLLIALYVSTSLINQIVYIISEESAMQYIYIIIGVLILFNVLFNFNKISLSNSAVGLISLLMGYYFMSYNKTYVEPVYFVASVAIPVVISMLDFDKEKVMRYIIIISVPLIFLGDKVFYIEENRNNISMGLTYIFLPTVCASILHFKYFRKEHSGGMYIGYIVNIYYLIQVVKHGSRGPILAIALLFVAMFIYDFDVKGKLKVNSALAFFMVITTIVIVMNYITILKWVQSLLASYNISYNFINKIIRLAEIENVSNGRIGLYKMALKGFINAPILGHGIASFAKYTNQVYPHNSLLQLMFDGGIVLTYFVVSTMINRSIKNLRNTDLYGFVFYMFLFFVSVPTSMVTGELFRNSSFWIFVFMLTNNKFMKKTESDTEKTGIEASPYYTN